MILALSAAVRAASKLEIYWTDREGGASTDIVTPAWESILIDTRNPNRPNQLNSSAARIHAAWLNRTVWISCCKCSAAPPCCRTAHAEQIRGL